MKKIFTLPNIQAVLFLVLSVAETVVIQADFRQHNCCDADFFLISNRLDTLCIQNRIVGQYMARTMESKNWSTEDDEPSDLAVGMTKATGYLLLLAFSIVLFF